MSVACAPSSSTFGLIEKGQADDAAVRLEVTQRALLGDVWWRKWTGLLLVCGAGDGIP